MSQLYTAAQLATAYKEGVISEELYNRYFSWVRNKFDRTIKPEFGHANFTRRRLTKMPKTTTSDVRKWLRYRKRKARRAGPYQSVRRSTPKFSSQYAAANIVPSSMVELKRKTSTIGPNAMNRGYTYGMKLGYMVKGNDSGNRTSNKILVTGLQIKFMINNVNTGSDDGGIVRVSVLKNLRPGVDFKPHMFMPEGTDFTPVAFTDHTAADTFQIIKQYNTNRLVQLFDKKYTLSARGTGNTLPNVLMIDEFIPMNQVFTYNTEADLDDQILPDIDVVMYAEKDGNTSLQWATNLTFSYIITQYFKDL